MSATAQLVQSQANAKPHINAEDDSHSNDLLQDDQHAMDIDAVADAAVEDSSTVQPIAYPGPEWAPGVVQEYLDHYLPEYEEDKLDPLLRATAAGDMTVLQQLLAELGSSAFDADCSGWTALHAAADSGQAQVVELLLAAGAGVNAAAEYDPDWEHLQNTSGQGETPLLLAALAGHTAVVQQLLAAGADVHAADIDGCTALHIAVEAGDSQLVQLLLDAGADVNAVNADNETPLHLAAEQDDVLILRQLLTAGAAADEAGGSYNATPLHYAALQGQLSTARELLTARADPTAQADISGLQHCLTPLQLAARHGHPDLVLLLLSGAHAPSKKRKEELCSALCDAITHGNVPCASLLIAAGALSTAKQQEAAMLAAIESRDSDAVQQLVRAGVSPNIIVSGQPALHLAASERCCNTAMLQQLLAAGAALTALDSQGRTALMSAVLSNDPRVVKVLLAAAEEAGGAAAVKAALNTPDKDGNTALHFAATAGNAGGSMVKLVLAAGADPDAAGKNQRTALHTATNGNHLQLMHQLLAAGAQVDAADKWGQTCLHYAIRDQHLDAARVLIRAGAAHAADNQQRTPLHVAASQSLDTAAVQLLLSAGAAVNAADSWGRTPLHAAAAVGNAGVVGLLLDAGAAAGRADDKGSTALHLAVDEGSHYVASLLLDKGYASVYVADNTGDLPLHIAAKKGHLQVVQLLLDYAAVPEAVNSSQHTALQEAILADHLPVVQKLLLWAPLCAKDLSAVFTFAMAAGCSPEMRVFLLRQLYAADPSSAKEMLWDTFFPTYDAAKLLMVTMLEELHVTSSSANAVSAAHAAEAKELAQQRVGVQHLITQLAGLQARQPCGDHVQQQQQQQGQQARQLQQQEQQQGAADQGMDVDPDIGAAADRTLN
jgi:ankyrin repeat protein